MNDEQNNDWPHLTPGAKRIKLSSYDAEVLKDIYCHILKCEQIMNEISHRNGIKLLVNDVECELDLKGSYYKGYTKIQKDFQEAQNKLMSALQMQCPDYINNLRAILANYGLDYDFGDVSNG